MIGQTMAQFRIVDQLGIGGMSSVYKAIDTKLGRPVALKFLPWEMSENTTARARFIQEAQAASALDHPSICTVYQIDETDDGMMYIAMAYYEGETISQLIKRAPVSISRASQIAGEVCEGLYAAHQHGIIHRDIKPANIIITKEGTAKILDFGVAKLIGASRITQEGSVVGTAFYMSPEQTSGLKLDHRSDVWSLGVVLYQMVSGQLPFSGDNPVSVQRAILFEDPPPIDLPGEEGEAMNAILRRALAKEPADRYQDMRQMRDELQSLTLDETQPVAFVDSPPSLDEDEAATEIGPEASIAVLQFSNHSIDPENASFCRGLADSLLHLLSGMEKLRVVSNSREGESPTDPRKAGEELAVRTVLEGSVHRSEKRLRVTARLLEVRDGQVLWSEKYDRTMDDPFDVQDEISQAITTALHQNFFGQQFVVDPVSATQFDAHLLYLKGRFQWSKRTQEGFHRAIEYFEQAITNRSGYARAQTGLADSWTMLGMYGYLQPDKCMPQAQRAIEAAFSSDDSLAEAYASQGTLKALFEWDFENAERDYDRAIHLDPTYANSYQWKAMHCLASRWDDSRRPTMPCGVLGSLIRSRFRPMPVAGLFYYFGRQYGPPPAEVLRKTLEIDNSFEPAHVFLGQVYDRLGRHAEALAELGQAAQLSGGRPDITVALAQAHAQLGHRDLAQCFLDKLLDEAESRYVSPTVVAQVYAALGEIETALTALERGRRLRAVELIWLGVNPIFDPLRDEPRFRNLTGRDRSRPERPTTGD